MKSLRIYRACPELRHVIRGQWLDRVALALGCALLALPLAVLLCLYAVARAAEAACHVLRWPTSRLITWHERQSEARYNEARAILPPEEVRKRLKG